MTAQIAGILLLALPTTNIWMEALAFVPFLVNIFVSLQITNILTLCIAIVGILSHITVAQRLMYARKVILAEEQGATPDV